MYKEDCIFCKIAKKEVESAVIYQDEKFIAILDAHPNTKGQTLVLIKEHYNSYVFDLPDDLYIDYLKVIKKIATILEKGLSVKKISVVFEGQGVDHIHAKLYPMHGVDNSKFGEFSKEVYFEKYPGYITTLIGPFKSLEERKKISEEILSNK